MEAKRRCISIIITLVSMMMMMCVVCSSLLYCNRKPVVIFNFGDSNSDTGGLSAALGFNFGYPDGRSFFHQPSGRISDGRLIIDFLCEAVNTSYLTPYLESLAPDFSNGANFAIAGAATLPRYVAFSLDVQVLEFIRFRARSSKLYSTGFKNVVGEEEFKNALYTFDIGQNDLAGAFSYLSHAEAINKIPSFIAEIKTALWGIYQQGGRNFWIHNTGPLGCLPQKLAATNPNAAIVDDIDEHGCLKSLNEGAQVFNTQLSGLCDELRLELKDATIVYVDVFSIKYQIISNSGAYGFENALMACCGFGGAPYNYNLNITCGQSGYNVCEEGSRYISWDGVHYTEAANSVVASHIMSTNYSTPPIAFNFFCY